MKIRIDFVTNSSSTSFFITNKTKEKKTLVDFVKENIHLLAEFQEEYGAREGLTEELFIKSAELDGREIIPGRGEYAFGDESGTLVGTVFDYMLRNGGSSKSFSWAFNEWLR